MHQNVEYQDVERVQEPSELVAARAQDISNVETVMMPRLLSLLHWAHAET